MKLRASQIKGCSFCVDMHAKVARVTGEEEEYLPLVVWRPRQTGGGAAPDRTPIASPAVLQIAAGLKGRP